jgi:hypothetical protein
MLKIMNILAKNGDKIVMTLAPEQDLGGDEVEAQVELPLGRDEERMSKRKFFKLILKQITKTINIFLEDQNHNYITALFKNEFRKCDVIALEGFRCAHC